MMKSRILTIIIAIAVLMTFAGPVLAGEDAKLDLNTATAEQLAQVPGLNPDLAGKIIELREENGEFVDMDELLDVDDIDNNLLRALKQHLFIKDVAGCNC